MNNNPINKENNESTVELRIFLGDIWRGARKFGWIVVALAVFLGGVQFYRSYKSFVPAYQVSATFTVHTENKVLTGDNGIAAYSFYYDRETADQLATVFPHIISNNILRTQVCNDLGVSSMPASVSAKCVQGTNMVTLTATGTDPQMTYDTLLSVIENYPALADYIIGRTKVVMINEPLVPEKPSNQGAWIASVSRAALIGAALGVAWIVVYAFLRKTIRTKEDVRTILNQHCVAVLPQVVFKKYRREIDRSILITNHLVGNDFLESLRLMRGSLQGLLKDGKNTVMVTSTAPAEGKTVVAANLASIFAKEDKKVLLIDADLRDSGLTELLGNKNVPKTEKEKNNFYRVDTIDSLSFDLLTFNKRINNVQKIVRSEELKRRLNELMAEYDFVFVDTPPCGIISDATMVAQLVDAIVYVIREDAVMQKTIRTGINSMLDTDAQFLGCILNGTASGFGGYGGYYRYSSYYQNYRYGYSSKYGYSKRKNKK
ncbi:MAG: AAA family ATPase [Clostridia bacterium]|nr:AAA family ATPase [Clostridia bacterium]